LIRTGKVVASRAKSERALKINGAPAPADGDLELDVVVCAESEFGDGLLLVVPALRVGVSDVRPDLKPNETDRLEFGPSRQFAEGLPALSVSDQGLESAGKPRH
jgi:hypothetical protein